MSTKTSASQIRIKRAYEPPTLDDGIGWVWPCH